MPGASATQSRLDALGPVRGERFLDPACRVCAGRAVPGEGGGAPSVFFVGEAPGPTEEREGRPFVGRAGGILRSAIDAAGWPAGSVWITNVVKSFPFTVEGTKRRIRRPTSVEVAACLPHLVAEVHGLRPRLAVALGRTAAEGLLGRPVDGLGALRGRVEPARAELAPLPVFVTYHPSGLHYGHATVDEFTADLRAARSLLAPP